MEYSKVDARKLQEDLFSLSDKKKKIDWDVYKTLYTAHVAFVQSNNSLVPLWKWSGFSSWENFVEDYVKITTDRARKYILIYKAFKDNENQAKVIDIKKLETIAPITNQYNKSKLLTSAKDLNHSNLKKLVSPQRDVGFTNLTFRLKNDEYNEVTMLIDNYALKNNLSRPEALVRMLGVTKNKRSA